MILSLDFGILMVYLQSKMNNPKTFWKLFDDLNYFQKVKIKSYFNRWVSGWCNFKTDREISRAISKLKDGKSCGKDSILNEMIKAASPCIIPVLEKLFNHILTTSTFPGSSVSLRQLGMAGHLVTLRKLIGQIETFQMFSSKYKCSSTFKPLFFFTTSIINYFG
jgi:hypothetical protein